VKSFSNIFHLSVFLFSFSLAEYGAGKNPPNCTVLDFLGVCLIAYTEFTQAGLQPQIAKNL
jgi:hypothetical protein